MIKKAELDARQRGETESARSFVAIRTRLAPLLQKQFGMPDIPLTTPTEASKRSRPVKPDSQEDQRETTQDRRSILRGRYEGAMSSKDFYTPTFQKQFWTDMFADDPSIVIPQSPWTTQEMQRPIIDVRGNEVKPMLALVPNGFIGREGLVRVGHRYPWLRHSSVQDGTHISDRHVTLGYVKVEATHNAPNLDTTEEDIVNYLKRGDRSSYRGQREGTYVLFGEALYVLTGEYPDLRTISRLPGSVHDGSVVDANRDSDGRLRARWGLDPRHRRGHVGFRLEEVKST